MVEKKIGLAVFGLSEAVIMWARRLPSDEPPVSRNLQDRVLGGCGSYASSVNDGFMKEGGDFKSLNTS